MLLYNNILYYHMEDCNTRLSTHNLILKCLYYTTGYGDGPLKYIPAFSRILVK